MKEIENLPKTWAKAQVRELVDLINGFAFKPSHWKSHGLPIIRIQNLNNPEATFNYCPEDLPRKYLVDFGDLLFAWSGTPGTSFGAHIWQGGKAWLNQHIFKIQLNEGYLNKKFLRLAINQNLNQYIRAAHGGAGLAHITKGKFESSGLMIPPLREQKRIIDEIEKQFTRLDAAAVALRRIQANLRRYRASVLKAACEGRLVPTEAELAHREGRDYEPADRLLTRILKERRATWEADQLAKMQAAGKPPKDDKWKAKYQEPAAPETGELPKLPEGWVWATWDQVGFSQNGRSFPSAQYSQDGVKLLRPGNLFANGRIVWTTDNTRYLPKKWAQEFPHFIVGPHELVMNLTAQSLKDEFLGRVCLTGPGEECLLNQRLARLTPSGGLHEYFLRMFKSQVFRRFVDDLNKGSLIQHMFTSQLAEFILPLPPLAEQRRIAAEVERRFSMIDDLGAMVDANLKRTERLRQAILKRAFEGRLVPQDPNDEPAGALLERIRAERTKAEQTRAPRGE